VKTDKEVAKVLKRQHRHYRQFTKLNVLQSKQKRTGNSETSNRIEVKSAIQPRLAKRMK
jgi:hypothetical protein